MVVALLVVALLAVLVGSAASLASGTNRSTPYWRDRGQSFYVAESGLNHCLWKLKYDGAAIAAAESVYPNGTPTFTSSNTTEGAGVLAANNSYEVWVKADADPLVKHITVAARSRDQGYVLKCAVRQEPGPPFQNPLGEGVISPDPNDPVIVGPEVSWLGPLTVGAGQTLYIGPGTVAYESVTLNNDAKLRLLGDTILWVRSFMDLKNSAICNVETDGFQLIIFIPPNSAYSQSITVRNSAVLNAFVYAPEASVSLKSGGTVNGMLVVKSCDMKSNAHYSPTGEGVPWPATSTVDWIVDESGYGE